MLPFSWLPPLEHLEDHGGDPSRHLEAVYARFRKDFIESRPTFQGCPVGYKKHPIQKGKEAGFWHIISEGGAEPDRMPDLRRYERIGWPRALIEAAARGYANVWQNRRGRKRRFMIALPDFSYVVVLEKRRAYFLLWTAYPVSRERRRQKLQRESEAWKGAQNG